MSFQELVENDKKALLRRLEEHSSAREALPVLEEEMKKLLIRYNEHAPSEEAAVMAAASMHVIGSQLPMMLAADEAAPVGGSRSKKGRFMTNLRSRAGAIWIVLFLLGTFGTIGAVMIPVSSAPDLLTPQNMRFCLGALGVSVFLFLGAALLKGLAAGGASAVQGSAGIHVDPNAAYAALHTTMITLDRELDETLMRISRHKDPGAADGGGSKGRTEKAHSEEEIELFAGLLEAGLSGDAQYALDKIGDVRFYLHRCGIACEDYSEEHSGWFERMPAMKEEEAGSGILRTIRPALVKDGKLLKKGLAV